MPLLSWTAVSAFGRSKKKSTEVLCAGNGKIPFPPFGRLYCTFWRDLRWYREVVPRSSRIRTSFHREAWNAQQRLQDISEIAKPSILLVLFSRLPQTPRTRLGPARRSRGNRAFAARGPRAGRPRPERLESPSEPSTLSRPA